jgi:hypothetical protein
MLADGDGGFDGASSIDTNHAAGLARQVRGTPRQNQSDHAQSIGARGRMAPGVSIGLAN